MAAGASFWNAGATPGGSGSVLDWISVSDHGATGDGTTDDTVAIQAAVDATPQGGVCYFPVPDVDYKITAPISVPHSMRLTGDANYLGLYTKVRQATANTSGFDGPTTGSEHWVVEGLHIAGPEGGQTAGAGLVSTQSVLVSRCYVTGFYDGLYISTDGTIDDAAYYSTVVQSHFNFASRNGVRLVGVVHNFTWLYSSTSSAGVAGVRINGGPTGVRFFGGAIENAPIGIDVDSAGSSPTAGVLIAGVYFETGDGRTDIRMGNTATVYAVRVECCVFIKSDYSGTGWHIVATNLDGLTIEDNEFTSDDVVSITSPATNVTYGRNHNNAGGTITLPSGSIRTDSANVTPEPIGDTATPGTSHYLARADHVHVGDTADPVTAEDIRDAGRWEVVVDGNPAAAITTPDGTDWVYGWITA